MKNVKKKKFKMVRVKKIKNKNDTSTPSKRKQKTKEELEYQHYMHSKKWKEIRLKVLERDEYRCKCCAREVGDDNCKLTVHHSVYQTKEGLPILYHEDEGDNLKYLITLCGYCHQQGIHRVRENFKRFSVKS